MSIARHTAYNVIGAVVPLVTSLITVPLYLEWVGIARYGLLTICWLLVGYFNLFDFGLGRATAQRIATLSDHPDESRSRLFWTAAMISALFALTAAILFIPLAQFAVRFLDVSEAELASELANALPLLTFAVPLSIAQSLFLGAMEGRREFFKINLIMSAGTIATATLPLIVAAEFGPQLAKLVIATLVARSTIVILLAIAAWRTLPIGHPRLSQVSQARGLVRFGGWTTVTNIVGPLMVFLDRYVIGVLIGSAAVGLYAIPFNLVSQLAVVPAALAGALMPHLAGAKPNEARQLVRQSSSIIATLATPLAIVLMILIAPFLRVWIGEPAEDSIPVAYVLLVGFWANSLARIPAAHLIARGRPDKFAKLHLSELIPYLALLWIGLSVGGLVGAAIAWSTRCVADAIALYWIDNVDKSAAKSMLAQFILIVAACLSAFLPPEQSVMRWSFLGLIAMVAVMVVLTKLPTQVIDQIRWPKRNNL